MPENNSEIVHVPTLTNVKHLELQVNTLYGNTLLGWIPLIEACPILQHLTLKLAGADVYCPSFTVNQKGPPPLKCLKILEILGFRGCRVDLEFATCVLESAVMLEEVILDVNNWVLAKPREAAVCRAKDLERKLPEGAKLTLIS